MKTSSKIAIVLLLFSVVASAQQPDNIFKKNKNGDLPATRLAVTKNLTNQTQILKQINIFRIEDGLTPINPDKANDFFANTLPQNIYDNAEDKIIKANVNVPIERLPGFAAGEEYNLWQNLEVVKATVSNEGMQKYFQSVLEQFQLPTEIKKQLSEQFVSGKFEDYKLLPGSVLEQVAFLSPPATDAFISFLQKNRKNIIGAVIKGDYKIVKAVPLADHHQPLGLVIKYNDSETWNVNDIDGVKLVDGKVYVKNSNDIPASLKAGTADNPAINLYQKTVFLPFIGDNDPDYFTKNSLDFQFVSGSDDKYLYVVGIIRHQYENTANWTGLLNIFWYKVDVADLPIQPVKKAATEKKPKVIQEAEIVADAESQLVSKNAPIDEINFSSDNVINIGLQELDGFIRNNFHKLTFISFDKEHDIDHKIWCVVWEMAWASHEQLGYDIKFKDSNNKHNDLVEKSTLETITALTLIDGRRVIVGNKINISTIPADLSALSIIEQNVVGFDSYSHNNTIRTPLNPIIIQNPFLIILNKKEINDFMKNSHNDISQISFDKNDNLDRKIFYQIKEVSLANHLELGYAIKVDGLNFSINKEQDLLLVSALILKDGKRVVINDDFVGPKIVMPADSLFAKMSFMIKRFVQDQHLSQLILCHSDYFNLSIWTSAVKNNRDKIRYAIWKESNKNLFRLIKIVDAPIANHLELGFVLKCERDWGIDKKEHMDNLVAIMEIDSKSADQLYNYLALDFPIFDSRQN